jgi:hypothetical protein
MIGIISTTKEAGPMAHHVSIGPAFLIPAAHSGISGRNRTNISRKDVVAR